MRLKVSIDGRIEAVGSGYRLVTIDGEEYFLDFTPMNGKTAPADILRSIVRIKGIREGKQLEVTEITIRI